LAATSTGGILSLTCKTSSLWYKNKKKLSHKNLCVSATLRANQKAKRQKSMHKWQKKES